MELQRNPLIFANEDLKDPMRILKTYILLVNMSKEQFYCYWIT